MGSVKMKGTGWILKLTSRQVHPQAQDGELWEQSLERWTWIEVDEEDTINYRGILRKHPRYL